MSRFHRFEFFGTETVCVFERKQLEIGFADQFVHAHSKEITNAFVTQLEGGMAVFEDNHVRQGIQHGAQHAPLVVTVRLRPDLFIDVTGQADEAK